MPEMARFRTLTQRFGTLYALVIAVLLSVGAVVTWTSSLCPSFPTEREGTVVEEPDEDGDLKVKGASGGVGRFPPLHLRLREGA